MLDRIESQPAQLEGRSIALFEGGIAERILVRHHREEEHGQRQEELVHAGMKVTVRCGRKLTVPRGGVKGVVP